MLVRNLLASVVVMTFSIYVPHVTAWSLQSDPETVDPANTDNVEISCKKGHSESPAPFRFVNSVHITKLNAYGIYEALASMNFATGTVTTIDANFTAHASDDGLTIETINVSYALGRYECVISGIGKLNQVIQISLPPVSIKKREVTIADVLDRLQQQDRELRSAESQIKNMIGSLKSELKSNLTYISNVVDENNMALRTILKERFHKDIPTQRPTNPTQKLTSAAQKQTSKSQNPTSATQKQTSTSQNPTSTTQKQTSTTQKQTSDKPETTEATPSSWPKGEYTLYETRSGCPSGPLSTWKKEWLAFGTGLESPSRNKASSNNHFRPPLFFKHNEYHAVNMTLCFHSATTSSFSWPSGSYCIGYAAGSCLNGFTKGDIDFNYISYLQRSIASTGAFTAYCCRNDGHPNSPISLPVDKPFYLFRFGGTCQQVNGMTVREEFMTVDTNRSGSYNDRLTGRTPDVTLNPVTLYFCYYFATNK